VVVPLISNSLAVMDSGQDIDPEGLGSPPSSVLNSCVWRQVALESQSVTTLIDGWELRVGTFLFRSSIMFSRDKVTSLNLRGQFSDIMLPNATIL